MGQSLHTYIVKYSVIEKTEKERTQQLNQWTVTGNDFLKSMLDESKIPQRPENTVIVAVDNSNGIGVPELVIDSVGGYEKAEELDLIILKTSYIGRLLMKEKDTQEVIKE